MPICGAWRSCRRYCDVCIVRRCFCLCAPRFCTDDGRPHGHGMACDLCSLSDNASSFFTQLLHSIKHHSSLHSTKQQPPSVLSYSYCATVVALGEPSAVSPALLSAGWSFLFVLSEAALCLGTGCASALIMCPVSMLVCVVQSLGGDCLAHNQHYRLLVPNARFGGFTCQSLLVLLGMPGQGTRYLADGFGFCLSDTAPCLGSGSSSALIMCSALLDALLRC